jgi:hypothetical protein
MWFLIQLSKMPNLKRIRKQKHSMVDIKKYQMLFLTKKLGRRAKAIARKEVIELSMRLS